MLNHEEQEIWLVKRVSREKWIRSELTVRNKDFYIMSHESVNLPAPPLSVSLLHCDIRIFFPPSFSLNQKDPIKDKSNEQEENVTNPMLSLFTGSWDLPPAGSKADQMRAHVTGSLNLLVSTVSQLEGHLRLFFFFFLGYT